MQHLLLARHRWKEVRLARQGAPFPTTRGNPPEKVPTLEGIAGEPGPRGGRAGRAGQAGRTSAGRTRKRKNKKLRKENATPAQVFDRLALPTHPACDDVG